MTIDPSPSSTPSKTPSITCNIRRQAIRPGPHDDATLTIKNAFLMFDRISFVQQALIGRRTCVMRAAVVEGDSGERDSESITIKSSFIPDTKVFERHIVQDNIMYATNSNGVELHTCVHNEAFPIDAVSLSNYTPSRDTKYGNCVLRLLVMTELFQMIDMTADTLIAVVKNVFKCYKWLHEKIGVIHRDINENNLMYWKKADGTISGVLSNYDLSLTLARQDRGPRSKQRLGTRPFLACDLLEATPIQHLYRHDLESLFYVIIVLTFRFRGENIEEHERFKNFPELKDWFTLAPAQLLIQKKAFFATILPRAPPGFQRLYLPIVKMKQMFSAGYQAQLNHEEAILLGSLELPAYDESTMDGRVNFDEFQKILYL